MRETKLKWGFIDNESRIEEDYTPFERLRKPADDEGRQCDIEHKIYIQILIFTISA